MSKVAQREAATDLLDVYEFGLELLASNDLDPLYVALWNLDPKFTKEEMCRWLLAFWCFYDAGTASCIYDAKDYWKEMRDAAASKTYRRAHERRHFRGDNAKKSVAFLEDQGFEGLFGDVARASVENRRLGVQEVMEYVQEWVGFGPWISFKAADMLERLAIVKVRFDEGAMFLFDSPREGAEMLWKMERPHLADRPPPLNVGMWAVSQILFQLDRDSRRTRYPSLLQKSNLLAPPRYERPINAQEVETVLCKWKSYRGGHYKLGEDVEGLRRSLTTGRGKCRTGGRLLAAGKRGGLW